MPKRPTLVPRLLPAFRHGGESGYEARSGFRPGHFSADQTCTSALAINNAHSVVDINLVRQALSEKLAITGLTKFTRFETLYVILLNIHKRLPKQRCSSHFARPEEKGARQIINGY